MRWVSVWRATRAYAAAFHGTALLSGPTAAVLIVVVVANDLGDEACRTHGCRPLRTSGRRCRVRVRARHRFPPASFCLALPSLSPSALCCPTCSREVRKSIARVATVISQSEKAEARAAYKKQKYKPLDLRPKKTRAIRRQLSRRDADRKTARQAKRERAFPMRKYAVMPREE